MAMPSIISNDRPFPWLPATISGESATTSSPAISLSLVSGKGRNRVVIENAYPQVDNGRHPIRRIVGDCISVTASIFADGHDQLCGRLLYRHESDKEWRVAAIKNGLPNTDPDRWSGSFFVDKIGLWSYTVEGWVDHFATWARDLKKTFDALTPIASQDADLIRRELPIKLRFGAALVEDISQRARGEHAKRMLDISRLLKHLADEQYDVHGYPLDEEAESIIALYPDLTFATRFEPELHVHVDRQLAGFSSWYEIFPRSASSVPGKHGTFADVERQLPEIAAMGFDIVYLPPIHPIGRTHRKGKNNSPTETPGDPGSPWAIGDRDAPVSSSAAGGGEIEHGGHKSIHPQLGDFESFKHLVATAASLKLELALDIAFQCSPDHPWVVDHPQWFHVRPDGSIQCAENPPKVYQDIFPLNFESEDWQGLWVELYSVFDFWIQHGVRVFRVDNPHTKALPFWEWCLAELRCHHPDVILLSEAFTRPSVMYQLAKVGFGQSYTYFTWRNTSFELRAYLEEITRPPISEFFRPNFWPSTPDILPLALQEGGPTAFKQRVILAATLSSNYGIYGPAYELCENAPTAPAPGKLESEEYLDSEKYQIRQRDRNASESLVPLIRMLNQIRRQNRALQSNQSLHFHNIDNDKLLCYSKSTADNANTILVVVTLDAKTAQMGWIDLDLKHLGVLTDATFVVEELLTGEHDVWHGNKIMISLQPELRPAKIYRISHPHLCSPAQLNSSLAPKDPHPSVYWREEE